MTNSAIERLNSMLRGELAAIATYEQALDNLGTTEAAQPLRTIHRQHVQTADLLRQQIDKLGGIWDVSSGAWGAFAKAVQGAAKLLGNTTALSALKEGEEHGIKEYERALADQNLPAECMTLITSTLLPEARKHVATLEELMAGLVA